MTVGMDSGDPTQRPGVLTLCDSASANLNAGSIHAVRNDLSGEFGFGKSGRVVAPDARDLISGGTAAPVPGAWKFGWINGSRRAGPCEFSLAGLNIRPGGPGSGIHAGRKMDARLEKQYPAGKSPKIIF